MTTELIDEGADRGPTTQHRLVGPYRLLQPLGEGGMGVVHLALDTHGKAVAIKLLRPHINEEPEARSRLRREVDALRRIRSPRVAPIIDAELESTKPFIVTRYVPGPALDDVVEQDGPLDKARLHTLAAGLVEAIEAIHAAGVVHRDVKPGNVLLLDDDSPVLIDFGIAHLTDDVRLTQTGLVMGTPGYLAPEIIEGGEVTRATDWWGWAATLAYAASGRPPFGRGAMESVLARVGRGEPDLTGVEPRLAPLLYAALSPRSNERPEARELVLALERFAAGGDVTEAVTLRRSAPATQALGVARTSVLPMAERGISGHAASPPPAAPPVLPSASGLPLPPPVAGPPSLARGGPSGAVPHPVAPVPVAPVQGGSGWAGRPQVPGASCGASAADAIVGAPPPVPVARQAYPSPHQPQAGPLAPYQPAQPVAGSGQPGVPVTAGQGDPRIGRPTRTGTLAAYLVLLVAAGAVFPVVTLAGVLTWLVLARTTDRSVTSIVLRRHERGRRTSDVPVAVVSGPWHLLLAVLGTVLAIILPLVVAVSAAFCAALVIVAVSGGPTRPNDFIPLAVGTLFGVIMLWWGPGGASTRRGSRSLVRGLSPAAVAPVLVSLLVISAGGIVAWGLLHGAPVWWPTGQPSTWSGLPLLP